MKIFDKIFQMRISKCRFFYWLLYRADKNRFQKTKQIEISTFFFDINMTKLSHIKVSATWVVLLGMFYGQLKYIAEQDEHSKGKKEHLLKSQFVT